MGGLTGRAHAPPGQLQAVGTSLLGRDVGVEVLVGILVVREALLVLLVQSQGLLNVEVFSGGGVGLDDGAGPVVVLDLDVGFGLEVVDGCQAAAC